MIYWSWTNNYLRKTNLCVYIIFKLIWLYTHTTYTDTPPIHNSIMRKFNKICRHLK